MTEVVTGCNYCSVAASFKGGGMSRSSAHS